ncbi:hypothetical protein CL617_01980 [archaeon]|nr:hypothetical protein [archaeon]
MTLLKFLKENEDSRKIFGKKELKIIEKQLFGINLTQSEKNRLSRDIRKKLEFMSKVIRYEDEFELKKSSEIKNIIEETKEVILNNDLFKNIKKIILYGSIVENKLTFRSDIDIALVFDKINLRDSTLLRKKIMGRINGKVDLQVYNHLPNKIKKEIDKKGKILYGK